MLKHNANVQAEPHLPLAVLSVIGPLCCALPILSSSSLIPLFPLPALGVPPLTHLELQHKTTEPGAACMSHDTAEVQTVLLAAPNID